MIIIFLYKCAFIIASSYYCLILFNFIMTVVADNNVLNNRMFGAHIP